MVTTVVSCAGLMGANGPALIIVAVKSWLPSSTVSSKMGTLMHSKGVGGPPPGGTANVTVNMGIVKSGMGPTEAEVEENKRNAALTAFSWKDIHTNVDNSK